MSPAQQAVLITGAGSGIGRSTAIRFAQAGATVGVADIDTARALESAEMVAAAGGTPCVLTMDVASTTSVDEGVAAFVAAAGRIDVVVNNAAVMDSMDPIHETTDAEWSRVLGVTLSGTFHVARRTIEALIATRGAMVNVASLASFTGARGGTSYTVAKHGVLGLTRSIAFMYADRGVRCNAVCPGPVDTNIHQSTDRFSDEGMARLGPIIGTIVRRAQPDEIATVICFLASDAASFVNGAVVAADGGWSAA